MYKFTLSVLLFSFHVGQTCSAQQFAPAAGNDGYYRVYSNINSLEGKSTSIWYFKVMEATDSSLLVDCTLLSYNVETTNDLFNTGDPVTCIPVGSKDLEMLCLLNRSFLYHLKRGRVEDQPSIEKLFEERSTSWQIEDEIASMMKHNAKSYLVDEMNQLFPVLANSTRALSFDSTLRLPVTEEIARLGRGMAITRLAPQEVVNRPLAEDVLTAIVSASRYSKVIYRAPLFDSAKMENYFARYDPVYGNANFYRLIKLGLLQSNLMANMHRYDSLLLATPDSVLTPYPTHLFNKAQEQININADSAYHTIRYLSKNKRMFQGWVQESFSQAFLHHEPMDTLKAELKKNGVSEKEADKVVKDAINGEMVSGILIDKLGHDPDTAIRDEAYPLYLWVQATQHGSNTDSLLQVAGELEKISGSKEYSNAHRYGLLVYKQLLASGNTREAAHLLDSQIAGMEVRIKDSSDHDRYAEQNMLAYAYKLKSDAVKAADPKAAMNYLSMAAGYSPKGQKEQVYTSFYDRVFLDSRESYRPEFAEALIRQGNTKDGMVVLSEQLNADPTFLEDLQKAFAGHFPEADFYRFFTEGVVKSWKTAPDFSLKSPDGQLSFKLADYRGKWLLIDFWGTWCGPCRAEMPKINDFVKTIGNREDLAFLSVACRDRKEDVIRYLADNNYHMPISMADNTVERKYEVSGYPSKFLISPSGTVLFIPFGQDWQKIVEQFTSVHPKKTGSKLVKEKNN